MKTVHKNLEIVFLIKSVSKGVAGCIYQPFLGIAEVSRGAASDWSSPVPRAPVCRDSFLNKGENEGLKKRIGPLRKA